MDREDLEYIKKGKIIYNEERMNLDENLFEDIEYPNTYQTMILKQNINESLQRLNTDIFITNNPYDIKNLLINKPKLYRIIYDSRIDKYIIGDGFKYIHRDLLDEAYQNGYYEEQREFIDSIGEFENYVEIGQDGGWDENDNEIESYLIYMIFDNEDKFELNEDGYNKEYNYDFGNIFTRDSDLADCELYDVLQSK